MENKMEIENEIKNELEVLLDKLFNSSSLKHYQDFDFNNYLGYQNLDNILSDTKILPNVFIKMLSRYLDIFIGDKYNKIINKFKNKYNIRVKFIYNKYQITRMILEVIFNRENTEELDNLFEQLKIYGNYVFNNQVKYNEIVKMGYDAVVKSIEFNKIELGDMKKKQIKLERDKIRYFNFTSPEGNLIINKKMKIQDEKIKDIETKIAESQTYILEYEEFNQAVYDYFKDFEKFITEEARILIKNKVYEYIQGYQQYFKNIEEYEQNDGISDGKVYEDEVYHNLVKILEDSEFDVFRNIEIQFTKKIIGVKLEYDYLIGKLNKQTKEFRVYGIFDAKLSKILIKEDIPRTIKSINILCSKGYRISLKDECKKKYFNTFNKISFPDIKDILIGYFYKGEINYEKEFNKVISHHIIARPKTFIPILNNIKIDTQTNQTNLIGEIINKMNLEYYILTNQLKNYNTKIYRI